MRSLVNAFTAAAIVCALSPAAAITLGGVNVPKDKLVVFLAIGHSNMAGRVDDIDTETYETHPRAWNFKFDDGTDAWLPAQAPVHRDVSWHRGGGPATPFLKQLVADHPGLYFGVIQNAHSSVTVVNDYRRGLGLYDEIVAVAQSVQADVTFGGVIAMLGYMESGNAGQSADVGNQLAQMMGELRADLNVPNLPLVIHQLSRGRANWQTVNTEIAALVAGGLSYCDIVPSDGPYKPGDTVHFTWVGQKSWGRAAAGVFDAHGWIPGAGAADAFAPSIARAKALDGSTIELIFGEPLDASTAESSSTYATMPGVSMNNSMLDANQKTITLSTGPMTSGTTYTLTVDGIEDLSGNAATGLVASVPYELVNIPYADLNLWLRADKGIIKDTVSSVPLWVDQSDNGNDAIRARFANHPYWIADAINGQPALNFGGPQDPEGDFLTRTLPAAYVGDNTFFMVFAVTAVGQPVNASIFSGDSNGGSQSSFQIQVDGGDPGNLEFFTDMPYAIGPTTTAWRLLTARVSGVSLELFVDGIQVASHTIGAGEAKRFEQYALGHNRAGPSGEFLHADVAELLIYHAALSPSDRTRVEQYLGSKYGLTASPAGFRMIPSGGLITTEAGASDTFTVVLSAMPSADVSLPVASSDTGEGTVSTASLLFTTANWNAPQTVTVYGADDATTDGNVDYTILLGPATSADNAYDGIDPTDVTVTNLDDDGSTNLTPQAVIAGPPAANVGVSVSFYGGGSTDDGTITDYAWDFGDGSTDTGQLVNYSWGAAGTYTVTLTVTDDGGSTAQDTLDVTVGATLQPFVTLLRPTGGETFVPNSVEAILWSSVDLDDIRIDFSSDGGATWELVGYSDINDPSWESFAWTVPDIEATECMIMVQGYNLEAPTQSGLFTITRGGSPTPPSTGSALEGGCSCDAHRANGAAPAVILVALLLCVTRRTRRRAANL